MKPAPFEYLAPRSLDQALSLLAEHGDAAKLLAGGQSLVPTMSFRLAQPSILIDLNRIPELAYIRELDEDPQGIAIGAMTRQRAVERSELVARHTPLVAETMPHIAHPQIRNRGTFGGSLAHADPSSELPAVALALEAQMVVVSGQQPQERRTIAAADFYTGLFETALDPDEMLVEVRLPGLPERSGWAFDEVARRHGDYALVGVAGVVRLEPDGRIESARIALLSVGEGPVSANAAAAALIGREPTSDILGAAAEQVARDLEPPSDVHASSSFRRHLARVVTERVLVTAVQRARGANPS